MCAYLTIRNALALLFADRHHVCVCVSSILPRDCKAEQKGDNSEVFELMFFVVRVNGSRAVAEFGNGTEVRHDSRHCTITDETRPSFLSQLRIVLFVVLWFTQRQSASLQTRAMEQQQMRIDMGRAQGSRDR